ncbi:MAG: immunoglobulin domain-containing protein [Verrucomicrobia bacterium]|nr:immunoglobulin domain-containing protein [Verrucomicrobiota bacterium]
MVVASNRPLPTTGTILTHGLSTNAVRLRFTYGKSLGNLSFDDVLVTGPKRIEGGQPPQTLLLEDVFIEAPTEYRSQDFNSWPLKMDFLYGTTQHQNWVLVGQSKVNTNKAYSSQSLQLSRASESSDYYVDFEGAGETKTSYASGTVKLSGLDWDMTDALIGTSATDWKNGSRSARMRGYGTSAMTMLTNKVGGLGTITFQYRRYSAEAQVDWMVQYSTNNGVSWTQAGSTFTAPANDIVQTFTGTVNKSGDVRIRIKRATETGTSNKRLNIDDILLTGYGGGGGTDASVNSQYYADGIGPISFQYRHWMDSAPPVDSILTTLIQTSSNGANWTTVDTLMISNTSYRAYEKYLSETNHHYARLLITNGNSVALFDDITIGRPQPPASVQITGWNDPTVPFTNDTVTLLAQVLSFYGARSLSVTSYYRIGTSGAYQAVGMTGSGNEFTSISNIPPQPVGTIVQYYMKGSFEGPGSDTTSPVYYPTNYTTSPAWYGIPRNPPGKVWINEIDYDAWDWFDNYEFIELAGEAGVDISGWKIEMRDGRTAAFTLFDSYTIPSSTTIPSDTNGFGFFVLGQANLTAPPRDLLLTNYLSSYVPGAVRVLNEMNGLEAALSYGGTVPAHTRIPAEDIEQLFETPTNSVALVGTGSTYDHFGWVMTNFPTPGAGNPGQTFADPAWISPIPTSLVFSYIAGSYSPAAQSLVVSNSGATPLSYTMATNASWLSVAPCTGDLVPPGSSAVHSVSVITDGLTGNKTAQITISGEAGNSPSVPVQLNETAIGEAILDYQFDEVSGPTANNQGTAGPTADLTLQDGATRTLEGGGVSSSEGDYALVSTGGTCHARSTGTVAAVHGITQFTITGWIKTSATGGTHRLLGNRAVTNGFALITSSNYQDIALVSSATGTPVAVTSTNGALADGAWQFFAVTFDASDAGAEALKFYRGDVSNGTFQFSTHARGGLGATGVSTGRLFVTGDGVNSFQGNMDALRFFNDAKNLMTIEAIRRQDIETGGSVLEPPTISEQPQSITNDAFTFAGVSVAASGTPDPVYQWRKTGLPLDGMTENSITFFPITLNDAGVYDVIVSNVAGWVVSSSAVVVVLAPPEILTHPTGIVVYVGETVNFSVNATGTPTMLYQWLKGGIPMGGETNTLLTLVNVQADQAANYRVDVTNRVAYSNSAVAVLTVKVLNMAEGGWIRKPTGGQGTFLRWPAISNRWYEVWWSSNLMLGVEGFVPVNTTLPSVVGANFITYTDSTHAAGGRGFYQIRSRTDP